MAIRKFYAVKVGRHPGVYEDWSECKEQIEGYDGAKWKKFEYDDAEENAGKRAQDEGRKYVAPRVYAIKDKKNPEASDVYFDGKDFAAASAQKGRENITFRIFYYDLQSDNLEQKNYELICASFDDAWKQAAEYAKKDSEEIQNKANRFLAEKTRPRENSLLLEWIFKNYAKSQFASKEGMYDAPGLYVVLAYIILFPERLKEYFARPDMDDPIYDIVTLEGYEGDDEKYLAADKELDELYKCAEFDLDDEDDLIELTRRLSIMNEGKYVNSLQVRPSAVHLRKWKQQGGHTIVDLYKALLTDPAYKKEILEVSGTVINRSMNYGSRIKQFLTDKQKENKSQLLRVQAQELKSYLLLNVVGQDGAVEKAVQSYFLAETKGDIPHREPLNVMLFAGPPGVGKTFLAEKYADFLNLPVNRFDMSAYSSVNAAEELTGISSFYRGAKSGLLTQFVQDHPRCVLIFDEIEKAHHSCIQLFLQILDAGTLFDRFSESNVSFSEATIIFTTNAGRGLYEDAWGEDLSKIPDAEIADALRADINPLTKEPYFPDAIVSRLASYTTVMFNHLDADKILDIIRTCIDDSRKKVLDVAAVDFKPEPMLAPILLYEMGIPVDARVASRKAEEFIISSALACYQAKKVAAEDFEKALYTGEVGWEIRLENTPELMRLIPDKTEARRTDYADIARWMSFQHLRMKYEVEAEPGKIVLTEFRLVQDTSEKMLDEASWLDDREKPTWEEVVVPENYKQLALCAVARLLGEVNPDSAPAGLLLSGDSGSGKTFFAQAIAARAGVPVYSMSGSEMLIGGEKSIQDIFRISRKYAPAVILLENMEKLDADMALESRNKIVNRLFTEMRSARYDIKHPVLVIGTVGYSQYEMRRLKNQLQSGELLKQFDSVLPLDLQERTRKFIVWAKEKVAPRLDEVTENGWNELLRRTDGAPIGVIERILIKTIQMHEDPEDRMGADAALSYSEEECLRGEARRPNSEDEWIRTSRHEAGHAILHIIIKHALPEFISVIPRGNAEGYMESMKRSSYTRRRDCLDEICICLGGRAAEMVFYEDDGITIGASGDIWKATGMAINMVCSFGMYEEVGLAAIPPSSHCRSEDDYRAECMNIPEIRQKVNELLQEQLDRACKILEENKDAVDELAKAAMNSPIGALNRHMLEELFLHPLESQEGEADADI